MKIQQRCLLFVLMTLVLSQSALAFDRNYGLSVIGDLPEDDTPLFAVELAMSFSFEFSKLENPSEVRQALDIGSIDYELVQMGFFGPSARVTLGRRITLAAGIGTGLTGFELDHDGDTLIGDDQGSLAYFLGAGAILSEYNEGRTRIGASLSFYRVESELDVRDEFFIFSTATVDEDAESSAVSATLEIGVDHSISSTPSFGYEINGGIGTYYSRLDVELRPTNPEFESVDMEFRSEFPVFVRLGAAGYLGDSPRFGYSADVVIGTRIGFFFSIGLEF